MDLKWIVIALLVLGNLYKLALTVVQMRSAGNPTPENVADVYDAETYEKWKRYSGEQSRLGIVSCLVSFALELGLLVSGAYAWAASLLPAGKVGELVSLGLCALSGLAVYFLLAVVFGLQEAALSISMLRQLRKRG